MKDLVCLLSPCDDLLDPLGSRRREGGDEWFHHTFIEFRRLLDEDDILLGILRISIVDDINERNVLPDIGVQTLRM